MTSFWWVNQNQTFAEEYGGEFLWSPQKNANDTRNPFYDFMTEVREGDIIFSFKGTYIAAIAIAKGSAYQALKPFVGSVGANWQDQGWKIDVQYFLPRQNFQPKTRMDLIAPLLPSKYSPIRADGSGNQMYFAAISKDLGQLLLKLVDAPELEREVPDLESIKMDPEDQEIYVDAALREYEKVTMMLARRGQGTFRDRVQLIEKTCRVTGVSSAKLLIASHIRPWRNSQGEEKLNGNNGLFLSPHVDKLFNDGWITFTQAGRIEIARDFDQTVFTRWGINPLAHYGKFNQEQAYFLERHQEEVFETKTFTSS